MNQDDLAYLSGLTWNYIDLLERDMYGPTLVTIAQLARSIGMEPYELVKVALYQMHVNRAPP